MGKNRSDLTVKTDIEPTTVLYEPSNLQQKENSKEKSLKKERNRVNELKKNLTFANPLGEREKRVNGLNIMDSLINRNKFGVETSDDRLKINKSGIMEVTSEREENIVTMKNLNRAVAQSKGLLEHGKTNTIKYITHHGETNSTTKANDIVEIDADYSNSENKKYLNDITSNGPQGLVKLQEDIGDSEGKYVLRGSNEISGISKKNNKRTNHRLSSPAIELLQRKNYFAKKGMKNANQFFDQLRDTREENGNQLIRQIWDAQGDNNYQMIEQTGDLRTENNTQMIELIREAQEDDNNQIIERVREPQGDDNNQITEKLREAQGENNNQMIEQIREATVDNNNQIIQRVREAQGYNNNQIIKRVGEAQGDNITQVITKLGEIKRDNKNQIMEQLREAYGDKNNQLLKQVGVQEKNNNPVTVDERKWNEIIHVSEMLEELIEWKNIQHLKERKIINKIAEMDPKQINGLLKKVEEIEKIVEREENNQGKQKSILSDEHLQQGFQTLSKSQHSQEGEITERPFDIGKYLGSKIVKNEKQHQQTMERQGSNAKGKNEHFYTENDLEPFRKDRNDYANIEMNRVKVKSDANEISARTKFQTIQGVPFPEENVDDYSILYNGKNVLRNKINEYHGYLWSVSGTPPPGHNDADEDTSRQQTVALASTDKPSEQQDQHGNEDVSLSSYNRINPLILEFGECVNGVGLKNEENQEKWYYLPKVIHDKENDGKLNTGLKEEEVTNYKDRVILSENKEETEDSSSLNLYGGRKRGEAWKRIMAQRLFPRKEVNEQVHPGLQPRNEKENLKLYKYNDEFLNELKDKELENIVHKELKRGDDKFDEYGFELLDVRLHPQGQHQQKGPWDFQNIQRSNESPSVNPNRQRKR